MPIKGQATVSKSQRSLLYQIPFRGGEFCEVVIEAVVDCKSPPFIQTQNGVEKLKLTVANSDCHNLFLCAQVARSRSMEEHHKLHKRLKDWSALPFTVLEQLEKSYMDLLRKGQPFFSGPSPPKLQRCVTEWS